MSIKPVGLVDVSKRLLFSEFIEETGVEDILKRILESKGIVNQN